MPLSSDEDGSTTTTGQPAETGDGDIRRLSDSASALHENFYENDMVANEVAERLDDIKALVDKFLPLLDQT